MCGIAGIFYKKGPVPADVPHQKVLQLLKHRGPDFQSFKAFDNCVLYHARLEIIDTTEASNQPFADAEQKNAMVFNGEIFNYKALQKNHSGLKTNGDVEVLFRQLKAFGKAGLKQLNGFFAFAFFDPQKNTLFVARDRYGVKPLYYYNDDEKFAFASEIKPLLQLVGKQTLNTNQLYSYFRLNYSAGKESMLNNIYRLLPGECIELTATDFKTDTWYQAPKLENKTNFKDLLNDAVKIRLQADVPVGTFLSGGIDSSIISALAKQHKPDLETFSIGFEKESYFDETVYSEMVAKHIGSKHHVFKLREDDFSENIQAFLNAIDEPFADSSAFNFYLLSKYTQQHVKVALSGDGADELFKGYNKHKALLLSENTSNRLFASVVSAFFKVGKSSRDGNFKNKLRQLNKFNTLAKLSGHEKQKFLAAISTHNDVQSLLRGAAPQGYFDSLFASSQSFKNFEFENTFDIQTVLADDMLVKADRFSMQHGIEIRNPFLDYRIVEYALNMPEAEKISKEGQKLILRKNFEDLLPAEIFTRRKKGFELPLQKWLSNQLRSKVETVWLNKEKIEAQGYLNYTQVKAIKDMAFSDNPGDSAAKLWASIVFQAWLENLEG
ncbi:MAG: asparagine synthase (glutamine-hydrolyzing) [Bacteroidia bacterium]|nr:asparagine synthase (glutamine-hydrolyzing) [Bacteroidia bacterium]